MEVFASCICSIIMFIKRDIQNVFHEQLLHNVHCVMNVSVMNDEVDWTTPASSEHHTEEHNNEGSCN